MPQIVGYQLRNGGVDFFMDVGECIVVDERNGQRSTYSGIPQRFSVSGDFNAWAKQPMARAPRVFTQFMLGVASSQIPAHCQFKFVIDDHFWMEPPANASNQVDSPFGPNVKNFLII